MKKTALILSVILFIILAAPLISAKEGHLKLLAVKETKDGYEGSIADLYLEIKQGSGRVFLDTFPLTKIDTQISTRFAKDIACSYLERDCMEYDFIYTIKADSPIIAGPSAGGAITLLTISMLEGFEVDEQISITGTINSGGIIGSVGGIKEKIDAAEEAGLKKVLIPEGERFIKEDRKIIETMEIISKNRSFVNASIKNKTIDVVEYGKKKGLEVVEVSDINDVLHEMTEKELMEEEHPLFIDSEYEKTMFFLASKLCNRSDKLLKSANRSDYSGYNDTMGFILNLTKKAELAAESQRYYSAASYCFGANVKLTYLLLSINNATEKGVKENIEIIERNVEALEKNIEEKEKRSVTDLEAYAVVKERLIEAKDYKEKITEGNISEGDIYNMAYSFERVYSAFSWANFFDHRGKEVKLNKDLLKSSCQDKIAEAEERYHYVSLIYPILNLEGTRKEIDYAYKDLKNKDYELCLFKATKAKAESDVILSVSGIGDDKIANLLEKKIDSARKNIAKQIDKGNFPVLAYSYYEYATELEESDRYSALLYSEYAMELSNLDMYFKQAKNKLVIRVDIVPIVFLILGILIGYLFSRLPKRKAAKGKRKGRKRKLV
ncbi:hypothetical protein KY366_05520 [Candidatus Woesearchaeota archaeon]|nr:hypothetical protein [Candidatus Woesearchaeota archaeon]